MSITRFQFKAHGKQYVLASEHEQEVARLQAELKELKSQPDPLTAYIYAAELAKDTMKRLKDENARLRKAGDDLAKWTNVLQDEYAHKPGFSFIDAWNAAKEPTP